MQKESKYKYLMSAADSCLYLSKMTYGLKKIPPQKNLWMLCNPYFTWLEFFSDCT